TYHRRAAVLRDVVARLDRGDELTLAPDELAVFDDHADVLRALHDLWTRRVETRVDLALELGHCSREDGVVRAWREVAAELPGVRRVLDEHADHPALRAHELNEHRLLAVAAGLAALDDPIAHSAAAGARLVATLRGSSTVAA
ncbi:MAG: hypothetical protein ACRDOM_06960, partial [Nocardioides sp.]